MKPGESMDRTMAQVLDFDPTLPAKESPEPYLVFPNPGTLEMGLVKMMGVSVEESDDPVGFFGTGLGYASATALRLGGEMTILAGGQRYDVRGREMTPRDKEFTQVVLNDEPAVGGVDGHPQALQQRPRRAGRDHDTVQRHLTGFPRW
jgi:hypothetical protein